MTRRRQRVRRDRSSESAAPPEEQPRRQRKGKKRRELTPEERAYKQARKRANLKMSVAIHAVSYAGTLGIILFFTRSIRVTMIVGVSWGFGLLIHYLVAVLAPELRQRWINKEVGREVERGVSVQRRKIEDRNVRNMEDLSASIAHEIRNPISAAKSLVQQMGEDPVADDNIEFAKVALDELDRVERSISHLLRFARDEELRFEDFAFAELVESAIETFRDRIARGGVTVEVEIDSAGETRGDIEKLRRVLINLIGNALDALEESGVEDPTLEILAGENLAGSELWLRIRDNGPGIDPENRAKVFSPFYTTKSSGTGLGLALSKKVLDAHGGTIELLGEPDQGAEFVLTFPKHFEASRGPR